MNLDSNILKIDEFLKLFSWPIPVKPQDTIENLWYFDLKVPIEKLWPSIINTNKLDKQLGYEIIEYKEKEGILYGSTGKDSFYQEWSESWEWNYCSYIDRLRKFTSGPFDYNRALMELQSNVVYAT